MKTQILSINSFYSIFNDFSKKVQRIDLFSNCLMIRPLVERMVEKGLFVHETDNRVMFLCDEGGFFQGYGAFNLAGKQGVLLSELPIVFDLDYGSELSEIQRRGKICLERLGFEDVATSVKMRLQLENFNKVPLSEDPQVRFKHATMENFEAINSLWETSLPSTVYMPFNTSELRTFIEDNQVLCAMVSGEIVAATQYQIKRGDCSFHHVAVDKNCRGQGLATKLISTALGFARETGARYSSVWVLEENEVALAFYRSVGFCDVKKHSKRFLLF